MSETATATATAAPKTLTAADILGADDRRIEVVDVPEWGGRVYVRSMMGDERDAFDAAGVNESGDGDRDAYLANYRARLVSATCCDETGKLLFTPHQVAAVGRKNSAALNRVVRAAQRLNGMTREAVAEEKKSSEAAPSEGSPTGSFSPPAAPVSG